MGIFRKKTKAKKKRTNKKRGQSLISKIYKGSLKAFRVVGVVVIITGSAALAILLYRELINTPYLEIRNVEIKGIVRVSEAEILRITGINRGLNILRVRSNVAESLLKAHPFVESVEISRRLPTSVEIIVKEREPIAFIKSNSLKVMDRLGVFFKDYSVKDGLDLPVITGIKETEDGAIKGREKIQVFELLYDLRASAHLGGIGIDDISEIHFDEVYGFSLFTLLEGSRIELGMEGFEGKLQNLQKVLKARGGTFKGINSVDLNSDRGVVVRFYALASEKNGRS
ncbi:MAG: FtsQ-type POTRA domain-containing protein [Deltaproteobacteria bacterium]|nr:FtsQ-type POTRA domain-containing protein [Deltaproteobacteria bacterium]